MIEQIKAWARSLYYTKREVDQRVQVGDDALIAHAALTAAHGATGAVVGTTNTQTLTNKTLTSPVITGSTGVWTAVTYVSGWEDFTPLSLQPVQYKKVGDLVFMRGICYRTSGSSGTILTLPTGYRPLAKIQKSVVSNALFGYVDIETDGDIVLNAGSPTNWVSLNDIWFSVV